MHAVSPPPLTVAAERLLVLCQAAGARGAGLRFDREIFLRGPNADLPTLRAALASAAAVPADGPLRGARCERNEVLVALSDHGALVAVFDSAPSAEQTRMLQLLGTQAEPMLEAARPANLPLDPKLAGGFAHLLRNALTATTFSFESLRFALDGPNGPDVAAAGEALQAARRGVDRALRAAARVTEYAHAARPPGGAPGALQRAVQTALFSQATAMRDARILVNDAVPAPVSVAMSDAALQLVLSHLLQNACDALADWNGPRRIDIALHGDAQQVTLTVADSGPGIAPEVRARLFEPFFTTRGARGTGLGLALCQRLVAAHRGTLTVGDPPGCAVLLTLPVP